MKFATLVYALLVQPILGGSAKQANLPFEFWDNDGNLCNNPCGSYKNSCPIESIQPTLDAQGKNACNLTAACNTAPGDCARLLHYVYPIGTTPVLAIQHSTLELEQYNESETCAPCVMPEGNFKESCYDAILDYDDNTKMCIFRTACDPTMRNKASLRRVNEHRACTLNEIAFSPNQQLTHVKNYAGELTHPNGLTLSNTCSIHTDNQPSIDCRSTSTAEETDNIRLSLTMAAVGALFVLRP